MWAHFLTCKAYTNTMNPYWKSDLWEVITCDLLELSTFYMPFCSSLDMNFMLWKYFLNLRVSCQTIPPLVLPPKISKPLGRELIFSTLVGREEKSLGTYGIDFNKTTSVSEAFIELHNNFFFRNLDVYVLYLELCLNFWKTRGRFLKVG
jgi:hypothetical protein